MAAHRVTAPDVGPAAEVLRLEGMIRPDVAVVLGSGLSSFADGLDGRVVIPYERMPGFPAIGVSGHGGRAVFGELGGKTLLALAGRVHHYEGRSPSEVTFAIRLLRVLGTRIVVVTNASGGIDPGFEVGDLMLIADQISMIAGPRRLPSREPFPMRNAYAPRLRALALRAAGEAGIVLREGVYAGSLGPSYETPAEVALARRLGAHAVGMSTVSEVQAAHEAGIEILGLSLITNVPLPGRFTQTTHAEVLEAGKTGAGRLLSLVAGVARKV
jgi:purine-nucleoside phosphorylase